MKPVFKTSITFTNHQTDVHLKFRRTNQPESLLIVDDSDKVSVAFNAIFIMRTSHSSHRSLNLRDMRHTKPRTRNCTIKYIVNLPMIPEMLQRFLLQTAFEWQTP